MGLKDKVKMLGRNYILALVLRKAWNGDYGKVAQWAVFHLSEIATDWAAIVAGATGALWALDHSGACALVMAYWDWFQCGEWAKGLEVFGASVTGVLATLGQTLGGLHLQAPTPGDGTKS